MNDTIGTETEHITEELSMPNTLSLVEFLKLAQRAAFEVYFDTAKTNEALFDKQHDSSTWLMLLGLKIEELEREQS